MPASLPDIYIHTTGVTITLQGASRAAIEFLGRHWGLVNGTTVILGHEAAEDAFALIDAEGFYTMTF